MVWINFVEIIAKEKSNRTKKNEKNTFSGFYFILFDNSVCTVQRFEGTETDCGRIC